MKRIANEAARACPTIKICISLAICLTIAVSICGGVSHAQAKESADLSADDLQLTTSASASADGSSSFSDGVYTIARGSKKLDLQGASSAANAAIQLYAGNGTPAQRWRLESVGGGAYRIISVSSGKVLGVNPNKHASGTPVRQRAYKGTRAQKWVLKRDSYGGYAIVSALFSDLRLGIEGTVGNGTRVCVYAANGSRAQSWKISAVKPAIADGYYSFENVRSGKMLDIGASSFGNGANVRQRAATSSLGQVFRVVYDSDTGYYTIFCANSGKVLDVEGASTANGANVQQYASNKTTAQMWSITKKKDGSLVIRTAINGRALTVRGGSSKNNANVQVQTLKKVKYQKWRATSITNWIPDGTYTVMCAKKRGKVLDIAGASQSSGANVNLYASNATNAQRFLIRSVGGGAYTIQNTYSGLYLDATSSKAGANIVQSTTREKWVPVLTSGGISFRLKANSSIAMMLENAGTSNSTNVEAGVNKGSLTQKWLLKRTSILANGIYEVNTATGGYALTAPVSASGLTKISTASGKASQRFELKNLSGDIYRVSSVSTDRVMQANASGTANAGSVTFASRASTAKQRWRFSLRRDGCLTVVSMAGGGKGVLTVDGSQPASGSTAKLAIGKGRSTQKWRVTVSSNDVADALDITLDQMVYWNWEGNPYNKQYLESEAELRSLLDPANRDALEFADLRKPTKTTAKQLNAFLATYGSNGTLAGMGSAFVGAAKKYGLNQDYLLAHAILESGWGTSELASGYAYGGGEIDGTAYPAGTYYNFFGIGAYDSSPLSGGRKLAIINGWNSRKKAIYGAAKWISENYTYRSYTPQYTLYAMKWDYLASNATKAYGWHQYATGGSWAGSIARIMGSIYDSTKTGSALVYVVPHYKS